MRFESRPRDELVKKQGGLNDRKDILSDLDSKLTSLQTKAERLTDPITDYFALHNASSSDPDLFTVSAGAAAELGNHSLTVERLAVSDTRVSKQYTDSSSSFGAYVADQTFSIGVGHPTDLDATNRESVSVTVAAADFTGTDDSVLLAVADAINTAMSNAVLAETIDSDEVVNASVVTEEMGKSRLVLRSAQSGYTYRMDFTDSADSLLADLEVSAAVASSGTAGGYITAVGTGATDSSLNAKFNLDGLTFYRDSNNVTDALSGVNFKLLGTFATTETLTVTADTAGVKEEVQGYLDAYNEALKYLKEQTQINPTSYERGPLADDITYGNILYDLRSYSVSTVSGVTNSDYSKLFNIGIEADDDGYLSIADTDKFEAAVEANSTYVAEIFNASDGIATQLASYLENYVKVGGTIDGSKSNVDDQLTSLSDRMDLMDDILARRESQLRAEFTSLQETMYRLSSQQSFLGSVFGT